MSDLTAIVASGAGILGLAAGYLLGYRHGALSGELRALKSPQRHRDRSHRPNGSDQRRGSARTSAETLSSRDSQ